DCEKNTSTQFHISFHASFFRSGAGLFRLTILDNITMASLKLAPGSQTPAARPPVEEPAAARGLSPSTPRAPPPPPKSYYTLLNFIKLYYILFAPITTPQRVLR